MLAIMKEGVAGECWQGAYKWDFSCSLLRTKNDFSLLPTMFYLGSVHTSVICNSSRKELHDYVNHFAFNCARGPQCNSAWRDFGKDSCTTLGPA